MILLLFQPVSGGKTVPRGGGLPGLGLKDSGLSALSTSAKISSAFAGAEFTAPLTRGGGGVVF